MITLHVIMFHGLIVESMSVCKILKYVWKVFMDVYTIHTYVYGVEDEEKV